MIIDYDKVNEFRGLDTTEAKLALEEYGLQFGINLRRNKSFDNMLGALERHVEENFTEDSVSDENDSDNGASSDDSTIDESEEAQDEITEEQEPSEGPTGAVEVDQEQTEEAPVENEDNGAEVGDEEQAEEAEELPENFRPAFSLTFYNSATGTRFAQVGYWITDEIDKLGKNWKQNVTGYKYSRELKTVIYYIQKYGSVTLRESRNGRFIKFD